MIFWYTAVRCKPYWSTAKRDNEAVNAYKNTKVPSYPEVSQHRLESIFSFLNRKLTFPELSVKTFLTLFLYL